MKMLLKAVFTYAIIVMIISIIFSFFISTISFIFALADGLAQFLSYGRDPISNRDPMNTGGLGSSLFMKFVIGFLLLSALIALGKLVLGGAVKGLGSLISKSTGKLAGQGMNGQAKKLAIQAKNMNARDWRRVGRFARMTGNKKLARGAYGMSDSLDMMDMLKNKKGLGFANAGKVTDAEKDKDKSKEKGDKKDEKDSLNSLENVRAQSKEEREQKAQEEKESKEQREEREKKSKQNVNNDSESNRDMPMSDRDKEISEAFHREADESFAALTDADMPGLSDMENDMNVSQNSEENKNMNINSSDALLPNADMADSKIPDYVAAGVPNVSPETASENAGQLSDRLRDTADTSAGLSSEDLEGVNVAAQDSLNFDDAGNALPSFAGDSIEATGESLSRNVLPYGNIVPLSVTESGDYSPENIAQETQPRQENYVQNASNPEFVQSVNSLAQPNSNAASSINPQPVTVPQSLNMSEMSRAVEEGMRKGAQSNPGLFSAPTYHYDRDTYSNPQQLGNRFAGDVQNDLSRQMQGMEFSLSKGTIDEIGKAASASSNAFSSGRGGDVSEISRSARDSIRRDVLNSSGDTSEAEKMAEEASKRFENAMRKVLGRAENLADEADKSANFKGGSGRNNGKVV